MYREGPSASQSRRLSVSHCGYWLGGIADTGGTQHLLLSPVRGIADTGGVQHLLLSPFFKNLL